MCPRPKTRPTPEDADGDGGGDSDGVDTSLREIAVGRLASRWSFLDPRRICERTDSVWNESTRSRMGCSITMVPPRSPMTSASLISADSSFPPEELAVQQSPAAPVLFESSERCYFYV